MADLAVNFSAPPAPPATRKLRPLALSVTFAALDAGGDPVERGSGLPVVLAIDLTPTSAQGIRRGADGWPEVFTVPGVTLEDVGPAVAAALRNAGLLP